MLLARVLMEIEELALAVSNARTAALLHQKPERNTVGVQHLPIPAHWNYFFALEDAVRR